MTERDAARLLEWNGTPLSCHLMLPAGTAGAARAPQPGRPAHRAGRPLHHRVRHLGRAQLPGRVRGRGRRGARRRTSGTTSSGSSRRTSRRWPSGTSALHVGQSGGELQRDRRPPAGRPVLRRPPQPWPPAPPRRVGQLAGLPGLADRAPLRHGAPVRHHPGHRHAVLHDQHRGRGRPGRRDTPGRAAPRPTRRPGTGSRRGGSSWPTRSASTCMPTCCRSRTSPAYLPPFLLRPDRAMTVA